MRQNSSATLAVLQGTENWAQEEDQKVLTSNTQLSKEIQRGDTMFYTSKKKKEELERYQDCSWFQTKSDKEDFASKLSPAEALIFPDFEVNELNLEMQFANRNIPPPWGDEYLEVFDEDDLHFGLDDKTGEKENNNSNINNITPSNENPLYANYKFGEDSSCINNFDNYAIRKVDSYDNMKYISSTNLSDVIPISYQEQLNNTDYNLQKYDDIKYEVKEELELYSPDSNKCGVDSDEGDLNIGREEEVGVEMEQSNDVDEKTLTHSHSELITKDDSNIKSGIESKKYSKGKLPSGEMDSEPTQTTVDFPLQPEKGEITDELLCPIENKIGLKLELNKNVLDNLSLNVPTPDLEFMDFVNYINNEKALESVDAAQVVSGLPEMPNTSMPLKESSSNTVPITGGKQTTPQYSQSQTSLVESGQRLERPTSSSAGKGIDFSDLSTVRAEDIQLSIAERIKLGSARKRSSRYCSKQLQSLEDENEEWDLNGLNDAAWDEGTPRKRKCRSRSSNSDSTMTRGSEDGRSEADSYRERRDKNNAASRRSRQNKKDKERLLFQSLEEDQRRNNLLKTKADKLEKLIIFMRKMLLQLVLEKGK